MAIAAAAAAKTATAGRQGVARAKNARIDFFYDVASPYSWLAFETLMRYRNVWDADINLRPFLLGGVMKATGNKPPGTIKTKGRYMRDDLTRMARYHGVPLKLLKDPRAIFNTLSAQRLLTAASMDAPAHLEGLTRELWTRIWGGGGEIVSPQGLEEACAKAGLSSDVTRSLLSRSTEGAVKDRLQEVTAEALESGAFGAPWICLSHNSKNGPRTEQLSPRVQGTTAAAGDTETFFGSDRLEALADALGQPWLGPHPMRRSNL